MKRKSIIQGISICVVLIFVALTCGCATTAKRMYTGEALPKEQVAIIEGSTSTQLIYFIIGFWKRHTTVLIREVDDKVPSSFIHKCEVLPGLHNVVVEVEQTVEAGLFFPAAGPSSQARRTVPLQFNTIAGHEYRIKIDKGISLVAVNNHSGEVVANKPIYLGRHSFGDISTLQQGDGFRMISKASWVEGIPQSVINTKGVLVATDNQLSFLVWNGEKYMPLFEFGYDEITKVELKKYVLGPGLVELSITDAYICSFQLKKEKSIEMADFISKKIGHK